MTPKQRRAFQSLGTVPERAAFLLDLGVTARTNIVGLELMAQAAVGEVLLPIIASDEQEAISKGVEWLKERLQETKRGSVDDG
ncbi:hypothetical protein [Imhoffiella purpurea]|uniref:Uncharacterized protein n=1 Tax=Imhoffiella purpurea TaxID=1249627 RepID=W9V275_9GAMM|nr:hypothetical protein [Imhoffiella purpurea]EXJ13598.1 hypothetical protein D779_3601 [Imhoffiella purpurea]